MTIFLVAEGAAAELNAFLAVSERRIKGLFSGSKRRLGSGVVVIRRQGMIYTSGTTPGVSSSY